MLDIPPNPEMNFYSGDLSPPSPEMSFYSSDLSLLSLPALPHNHCLPVHFNSATVTGRNEVSALMGWRAIFEDVINKCV